jgi:hypothetical protein
VEQVLHGLLHGVFGFEDGGFRVHVGKGNEIRRGRARRR